MFQNAVASERLAQIPISKSKTNKQLINVYSNKHLRIIRVDLNNFTSDWVNHVINVNSFVENIANGT